MYVEGALMLKLFAPICALLLLGADPVLAATVPGPDTGGAGPSATVAGQPGPGALTRMLCPDSACGVAASLADGGAGASPLGAAPDAAPAAVSAAAMSAPVIVDVPSSILLLISSVAMLLFVLRRRDRAA